MDNSNSGMSTHKAEAMARLSPVGKRFFKFIEFDDREELLAEIRKHPFGLFVIIASGILIAAIVLIATTLLALNLSQIDPSLADNGNVKSIIVLIGFVVAVLSVFATLITAIIYRSSVVYVTNEKIAEVLYISIFNRKITQLGMGSVEDVAVTQKGILARLFNYGTLIVETAGETQNATFTFVPKPNANSQIIIQAHEENIHHYGN